MRERFSRIVILFMLTVVPAAVLAEPVREKTEDGVRVTVERAADDTTGFRAFTVKAVNSTSGPRSLNMKIYLNKSRVKEITGVRGTCRVYMALPPGTNKTIVKQCKEKRPSDQWTFRIIKVYQFILK